MLEVRKSNLVFMKGAAEPYTGKSILYDEKGNKIYEGGFVGGRREGTGIEWHSTGQKKFDGSFKGGSMFEGMVIWYYIGTAQRKMELSCHNGEIVSGSVWNRDGSLRW